MSYSKQTKLIIISLAILLIAVLGYMLFQSKVSADRDYVSTSLEQCAVIDYDCPVNQKHFTDNTGCGCE